MKVKYYGVWGDKYYRSNDGETFSVKTLYSGCKIVFYHGNAITGKKELRILSAEEVLEIEFID